MRTSWRTRTRAAGTLPGQAIPDRARRDWTDDHHDWSSCHISQGNGHWIRCDTADYWNTLRVRCVWKIKAAPTELKHEYQTNKLAVVDGVLINARCVPELLLHLRVVSVYARLSVGQPGALRDRGCVALHGLAARVCFGLSTSKTIENRQLDCERVERRGVRDVCLYDLHRRTLAARFERRAAGGPARTRFQFA